MDFVRDIGWEVVKWLQRYPDQAGGLCHSGSHGRTGLMGREGHYLPPDNYLWA